jgi:hypothetical protein
MNQGLSNGANGGQVNRPGTAEGAQNSANSS